MGGQQEPELFIETPCIRSLELSRAAGCNIFLKLENLQPSGSFKSRGIGTLMWHSLRESRTGRAHFYCSSGGNAGLACAVAAQTLGQPCDIFVPSLTPEHVLDKLSRLGAKPHRAGTDWPEADAACRAAVQGDPEGVYVPPFDHEWIWRGASTLVSELVVLENRGFFPSSDGKARGSIDAIVCSVGGGGLLNGIMTGVELHYNILGSPEKEERPMPTVIAIETVGADSLAAAIRARAHAGISAITSVATSLGAPRVSAETYRTEWSRLFLRSDPKLVSAVIPDAIAIAACARFLDDERYLAEPACGATIASAYNPSLLRRALGFPQSTRASDLEEAAWAKKNIVLVVCGGSSISMGMLARYKAQFGIE
ncbi:tryptophan synthase beta subunit-like PLP-dependent enzyme [Xylariaceae sp. FL0594]|nr:tryptophan synthase beta subunit-like PLP-dependent enzyme [Xylariaceae sp. FL0594]